MTIRKPLNPREPNCIHYDDDYPASACSICKDGVLLEWAKEWEAWLAENPDSPEARVVAEMDASGKWEPIV